MVVDVAALILVALYTILGYRYGLTGALLNLAGIIAGYVSCVLWCRPAAAMISQHTGMAPLIALPVASIAIFLLVTRGFYLAHLLVRWLTGGEKKGPSTFLTVDRLAGAGFGFTKGVALVMFLLWALPVLAGRGEVARTIDLAHSRLVVAAQGMIAGASRWGLSWVVEDPNAQLVLAQTIANPRDATKHAADLASNPKVKALTEDRLVAQAAAERGVAGVVASSRFEELVADPAFQRSLKGIGFTPRDGRNVSREEIGRCLDHLQGRVERLAAKAQKSKTATELKGFLADPSVQAKLKEGDVMSVLKDPRLTAITGIDLPKTRIPRLDGTTGQLPTGFPDGL